ncbi:unnamed protein product [Phytophthora fragariaefolia]|uniref:Unnamed protein product n=1 Tax=Phytophthora fragariaefolia TaxID=1490495 RepID=A0A9W6TTL5_9STRA|nr:unnamed protein product [Phytophthora fragariaefolia]
MHQTLKSWACGEDEVRSQARANRRSNVVERDPVKREPPPTPGSSTRGVGTGKAGTGSRPRSSCGEHLRNLLSVRESARTLHPQALQVASRMMRESRTLATPNADLSPSKCPEVVDLTASSSDKVGGGDNNRLRRTRLHFGRNSIVIYDSNGSVDDFRARVLQT